jgi:SOS-response transcriptional repressor LexA
MNTSTFSERLNICLDKEGFPPKNHGRIQLLAEMTGLSHRGASKWVNGQSCPPSGKYASLAKKLNVSEQWLRTGEGAMLGSSDTQPISGAMGLPQEVNIYTLNEWVSSKKIPHKTMTCVLPYKGSFFGIALETEAMSPRFPNGSIIIFDDEALPGDGDFVLVDYEGLPEPVFRQLLTTASCQYLNAHNPKFDRLILTGKCRMLGKLVQAIVSFV